MLEILVKKESVVFISQRLVDRYAVGVRLLLDVSKPAFAWGTEEDATSEVFRNRV